MKCQVRDIFGSSGGIGNRRNLSKVPAREELTSRQDLRRNG